MRLNPNPKMAAIKIQRNEVWIKNIIRDISNDNIKNKIAVRYREFTIFVDGSTESLNKIESVEYRLPPTFPKPNIRIYERWNKFGYKAFAYQSFELQYTIRLKGYPPHHPGYSGIYFIDINEPYGHDVSIPIP